MSDQLTWDANNVQETHVIQKSAKNVLAQKKVFYLLLLLVFEYLLYSIYILIQKYIIYFSSLFKVFIYFNFLARMNLCPIATPEQNTTASAPTTCKYITSNCCLYIFYFICCFYRLFLKFSL